MVPQGLDLHNVTSNCSQAIQACHLHHQQITSSWLVCCAPIMTLLTHCGLVTPHGDTDIGQHLPQVLACCLTAPSHYLNQYWLVIKGVLWYLTAILQVLMNLICNMCMKMSSTKLKSISFGSPSVKETIEHYLPINELRYHNFFCCYEEVMQWNIMYWYEP